jgi:hypothetical protein
VDVKAEVAQEAKMLTPLVNLLDYSLVTACASILACHQLNLNRKNYALVAIEVFRY